MSYSIIPTERFEKGLKRLVKKFPSLKQEFASLIADLKVNPFKGAALGNSCYKIRISIASKGKGKSGGARVITNVYIDKDAIYLLKIYDKSEQEDITDADLKYWLSEL